MQQDTKIKNKNIDIKKSNDFKYFLFGIFFLLVLVSLMLAQILTSRDTYHHSLVLSLYLLQGFFLAFVIVRSGIGLASGFNNPVVNKNFYNSKLFILMLMMLVTFSSLLNIILWNNGTPDYILNNGTDKLSLMMVVGSFMIGAYIIFTKNSPGSILSGASKGSINAIFAIIGLMFGVFIGYIFEASISDSWFSAGWFNTETGGYNFYDSFGPYGGLMISLTILGTILLLINYFEHRYKNKTENIFEIEEDNEKEFQEYNVTFISNNRIKRFYYNLFKKNWTLKVSIFAFSIVGILSLSNSALETTLDGETGWGFAGFYGYWGAWVIDAFAGGDFIINLSFNSYSLFENESLVEESYNAGFWNHGGSMQILGMFIGTSFTILMSNQWDFKLDKKPTDYFKSSIIGLGLGFIVILAGGGYVSGYIAAISVGDISGYIYMLLAFVGTVVGYKLKAKVSASE